MAPTKKRKASNTTAKVANKKAHKKQKSSRSASSKTTASSSGPPKWQIQKDTSKKSKDKKSGSNISTKKPKSTAATIVPNDVVTLNDSQGNAEDNAEDIGSVLGEEELEFMEEHAHYMSAFANNCNLEDGQGDDKKTMSKKQQKHQQDYHVTDAETTVMTGDQLESLMEQYESQPRQPRWLRDEMKLSVRLPVKNESGDVRVNQRMEKRTMGDVTMAGKGEGVDINNVAESVVDADVESGDEAAEEQLESKEKAPKLTAEQLALLKKNRFVRIRERIATLANDLISDPEHNVRLTKRS